jgi:hypothetical protein
MNESFSVGAVLGTGFRVWFKNLIPFLSITTLVYAPLIIWGVTVTSGEITMTRLGAIANYGQYSTAVVLILNLFVSAALTFGVVMELQGQRASIGACIATGMMRFFPVLGVGVLTALAFVGATLAFLVPLFVILPMLYVATPAAVIERPGVTGALRRSRELTHGRKVHVVGILLVFFLLSFGLSKLVETVTLPYLYDRARIAETLRALPVYIYVDLARAVVVGSLGAVLSAVAYFYLRRDKEGTTASELARVFE